jgi:hypothetical protein
MWRGVQRFFAKFHPWGYQRHVKSALALYRRGEVRRDGLELKSLCSTVEIEWRARDIHPWDRQRPIDEKRAAFVAQTLADTEAAIFRLFQALPHVDWLQIRVFAMDPETPILAGTVSRAALRGIRPGLSIGMRLRELGITYHSAGLRFESLGDNAVIYDHQRPARFPELATLDRNRKM